MRISGFISLISTLFFQLPSFAGQIYRYGNPQDIKVKNYQFHCLIGGGENENLGPIWRPLLNSIQGGDAVLIRADGERGDEDSWLFNDESHLHLPKMNSVTTLVVENSNDANRPDFVEAVLNAELVFFIGGDQSHYIDWIENTKLALAITHLAQASHTSIAGTSAGMAYLAGLAYSGRYTSPSDIGENISSVDALNNPLADFVDLARPSKKLPFINDIITDTHFSERKREGRLVSFMAKAAAKHYVSGFDKIKAIAADENTAVCFNNDGVAKVYGTGNSFFLKGTQAPEQLILDRPLIWIGNQNAVSAYVLSGKTENNQFNLKTWEGTGGQNMSWWVENDSQNHSHLKRRLR